VSKFPSRLPSIGARLAGLDWAALEAQLDECGYARTPPLLTDEECGALVKLYGNGPQLIPGPDDANGELSDK
jgi:hypothetical protein